MKMSEDERRRRMMGEERERERERGGDQAVPQVWLYKKSGHASSHTHTHTFATQPGGAYLRKFGEPSMSKFRLHAILLNCRREQTSTESVCQ
jgi:hypothetical protein